VRDGCHDLIADRSDADDDPRGNAGDRGRAAAQIAAPTERERFQRSALLRDIGIASCDHDVRSRAVRLHERLAARGRAVTHAEEQQALAGQHIGAAAAERARE
jgi:hypothetical protein